MVARRPIREVNMDPVLLPANQPADRFYRGGPAISAFRRAAAAAPVARIGLRSIFCIASPRRLGVLLAAEECRTLPAESTGGTQDRRMQ